MERESGRTADKVARWQNLIPSFPWTAPGWRAWGRNPRKGRDQILPSGNTDQVLEDDAAENDGGEEEGGRDREGEEVGAAVESQSGSAAEDLPRGQVHRVGGGICRGGQTSRFVHLSYYRARIIIIII